MIIKPLKVFLGIASAFMFSTPAFSATTECGSMNDIFSSDGCYFESDETYNGATGRVDVRVLNSDAGVGPNDPIVYLVGPYIIQPPGVTASPGNLELAMIHEDMTADFRDAGVGMLFFSFLERNDDPLQRKSLALQKAIKSIDSYRNKASDPTMIIGMSLGGVVARHALTSLEQNDYSHKFESYISWDAPHLGAHVPLGIQVVPKFMANATRDGANSVAAASGSPLFLLSLLGVIFLLNGCKAIEDRNKAVADMRAQADGLEAQLDALIGTDAARQVLLQNVNQPDYGMDPMGIALQTELAALGFPTQTRNIAIIGGKSNGKSDDWNTQDTYFNFSADVNINPASLEMIGQVASGPNEQFFFGQFQVTHSSVSHSPYSETHYANNGYDTAPCSRLQLPLEFATRLFELTHEAGWTTPNLAEPQGMVVDPYVETTCFIPSLSAAAVTEFDLDIDPATELPSGSHLAQFSPFDVVWGGGTATAGTGGANNEDYVHYSTAYFESNEQAKDAFTAEVAAVYGPQTSCNLGGNATSLYGGFGIHGASVTNTGSSPIIGWTVTIDFETAVPNVQWSSGASMSANGNAVVVSSTSTIQPGASASFSLGGSYNGPTYVNMSCE